MKHNEQKSDGYSMNNFNTQYQAFQKQYAQAKDFVKFLSTLERQFKNLRGELHVIEETLPSLLTGLKLIWTISRHINQNETKMEEILDSISHEICDKVKSKIDITKIFKKKPVDAIADIRQGIVVLEIWISEFKKTKTSIEAEATIKRWEFGSTREIFAPPKHMIKVLHDLEEACKVTDEFYAILGPDLKAVTGSSEQINGETWKVKEQVSKLEGFNRDIFSEKNEAYWKNCFENFKL